mgnify:CR=1 FL=1
MSQEADKKPAIDKAEIEAIKTVKDIAVKTNQIVKK